MRLMDVQVDDPDRDSKLPAPVNDPNGQPVFWLPAGGPNAIERLRPAWQLDWAINLQGWGYRVAKRVCEEEGDVGCLGVLSDAAADTGLMSKEQVRSPLRPGRLP